jgi:competence ComEA-like helix-hairpin-helix protein
MFAFTFQERKALLFLAALILVGLGVDFFTKRYAPLRELVCLEQNIGKVELNQADEEELVSLPGIGRTIARRIIEYRSQANRFSGVAELKKVKGITAERFEKIKESVFVK